MSEDRLTIADCRPRFCVPGIKQFCDQLGIDFREFVREGYPIDELRHVDDPALWSCIEKARERIENT